MKMTDEIPGWNDNRDYNCLSPDVESFSGVLRLVFEMEALTGLVIEGGIDREF